MFYCGYKHNTHKYRRESDFRGTVVLLKIRLVDYIFLRLFLNKREYDLATSFIFIIKRSSARALKDKDCEIMNIKFFINNI